MKIILIMAGVLVLFFTISRLRFSTTNTLRPDLSTKPTQIVSNDKIIVVTHANYDDMKKALTDFCNIYNNEEFVAILRLTKISDTEFTVTFPYDIDFKYYSFLVNYIKYAKDIAPWSAEVVGWATTKPTDTWITEKSADKKVMLFLAEDDKEYDNVFLTTENNIGYKLGFAFGEEKQLLDSPKQSYIAPQLNIADLTEKFSEDFQ